MERDLIIGGRISKPWTGKGRFDFIDKESIIFWSFSFFNNSRRRRWKHP